MQINVSAYLERTVSKFPNKISIKDEFGNFSFSELQIKSQIIATKLNKMGYKNCPIPVYMAKCKEMIACFVGINYVGNFYIPLDVKSPESRLLALLDTLDAPCILTSRVYKDCEILKNRNVLVYEDIIECGELDIDAIRIASSNSIDTDPVYSIFTSGSTGIPKGVVIPHRGVIDYIDWAIETFHIDENNTIGNQAPFYFDNSTLDIYLMLATGSTLLLVPNEFYAFPAKLIDYLNENRVNFIFWVPYVLINIANFDMFQQKPLIYLEKVLFAGEVMPNKHLNYWRKHLPNCLYANLYGPTEITVDCTYYIVDREFRDDEVLPIGFPCKNTHILVFDSQNLLCKPNEIGELCVRGSSLALGYYNDREKTEMVFVQNPLHSSYNDLIYRTGDLVYLNNKNEIIFVGRKDNQIKHNGYRIELGEIENAAIATGYMKNACAVYDTNKKQIILFYQEADIFNLADFRKIISKTIPKYMVPSKFIAKESLPLNSNGKIDRLTLNREING